MNISITGRQLEVTPSLKEYIQKKVKKVKYYFEHIINVRVILEVKKTIHSAEVTIHSDEKTFYCEVRTADMYGSIDKLFDKVERQIRRYKEERIKNRKTKSTVERFVSSQETDEDDTLSISKVKEVAPKPKTEHEAILQLAMNNFNFEIFKEEKEGVKESIALKKDFNLYSLIQQNEDKWVEREVKLDNNEIIENTRNDYVINSLSIAQAAEELLQEQKNPYIIYHDSENSSLNVLYLRKNHTLGLLTSGGIS